MYIFYILTHSHTNQRQKTETEKATESERVTTVRQRYRDRLIYIYVHTALYVQTHIKDRCHKRKYIRWLSNLIRSLSGGPYSSLSGGPYNIVYLGGPWSNCHQATLNVHRTNMNKYDMHQLIVIFSSTLCNIAMYCRMNACA